MAWGSRGGTRKGCACVRKSRSGRCELTTAISGHPYNRLPTGREETTYVHEESHDSSTEESSHRHSHEPGNKYVPEEAPIHSLPRADPAHGHHGAHLEEQRHRSRSEVYFKGGLRGGETFTNIDL